MAPDAPPQVEVFPELPSFDRWNMALPRMCVDKGRRLTQHTSATGQ